MSTLISNSRQLGARIRTRRKEADLTATQAAALARVSRRLLVELEGGKRPNVGLSAVLRILDVLGLDLEVRQRGLPGTRSPGERRQLDV
jgi:transcriptional regulator with XRE-family HTH domain